MDGNMLEDVDQDETQIDEDVETNEKEQPEEGSEESEETEGQEEQEVEQQAKTLNEVNVSNLGIKKIFIYMRNLIKANYPEEYIDEMKQKHGMGVIPWDRDVAIPNKNNAFINVEAIDFDIRTNQGGGSGRPQPGDGVSFNVKLLGDNVKRVNRNEVDV